jgi:iron complex transport system substrate-binding protein
MLRAAAVLITAITLAGCAGATTSETPSTSGAAPLEGSTSTIATITAADLPEIEPVSGSADPEAPQRIISLATGVGETLVALGAADRVVGRDETSADAALADTPVVTEAHSVSAERVLDLDPDLVIVDARTTPIEALDQIAAAGVEVVEVPEAWTLDEIPPRITAVADAIGADATPLLADLPADTTPTPDAPRVAFLYLRGTSGIYLLGGAGSGADSVIHAAGGRDVGAEAGYEAFVPLTAEALATLDPDVLIVMSKGLESVNGIDGLVALPGVAQTRAGQERRVIVVDDAILLSFGPRTPDLIDALREALARVSA